MSNYSKKLSEDLNRAGFYLFVFMALITFFYVLQTVSGAFNPFLWLIAWVVESVTDVRYLPYSLSSTAWNNLGVLSFLPVLVALAWTVLLTALSAIGIGYAVFSLLKRRHIRKELGDKFLARYMSIKKYKKQKRSGDNKINMQSAQYKYYLEWKDFYKSSLTYDEWQDKVLTSKLKKYDLQQTNRN